MVSKHACIPVFSGKHNHQDVRCIGGVKGGISLALTI